MAMKQFTTAARRSRKGVANAEPVTFEWHDPPKAPVEMTAQPPSSGQLALFIINQNQGGVSRIRAMFELLQAVLEPQDWKTIEDQLQDGVDVEIVFELVEWMVQEWGARPTGPQSGSASSPNGTGVPSTETPPTAASTTSI